MHVKKVPPHPRNETAKMSNKEDCERKMYVARFKKVMDAEILLADTDDSAE